MRVELSFSIVDFTAMEGGPRQEGCQGSMRSWSYVPRRRRILPGDNFFEDGNLETSLAHKQMPVEDVDSDELLPRHEDFKCHVIGCGQSFTTVQSYELHYNGAHRNICRYCRRSYPSNHLLDIHILESHDSLFEVMAQRQPMYQCLVESCQEKFQDSLNRREHLIKQHHYPADFRFQKGISKHRPQGKLRQTADDAMETETPQDGEASGDTTPATHCDEPQTACHPAPVENRQRRVPMNICFGRGGARSFQRATHQKQQSKPEKRSGHAHKQKSHAHKQKSHAPINDEPMDSQLGETDQRSEHDVMNTNEDNNEQEPMGTSNEYS